uniref:Splicing factor U2af large subunit A n=1 Tax=Anthurium amnicola TaxID=1678845 RepID=A0A1D1ZFU7_9ARAE
MAEYEGRHRDNRDRDRYRERERDRRPRDHRDRSDRRDRGGRDRPDDNDHRRGRDLDRRRDHDREREGRHKHRSRSPLRNRSERRSSSRSRSRRISGFDMAPPATALIPSAPTEGGINARFDGSCSSSTGNYCLFGQLPGATAAIPGFFPNLTLPGQFPTVPMMPVQAMTQQATRHARRVYVGGLSPTANEQVHLIADIYLMFIYSIITIITHIVPALAWCSTLLCT